MEIRFSCLKFCEKLVNLFNQRVSPRAGKIAQWVNHVAHNQGPEFESLELVKHVPAIFVFLPREER